MSSNNNLFNSAINSISNKLNTSKNDPTKPSTDTKAGIKNNAKSPNELPSAKLATPTSTKTTTKTTNTSNTSNEASSFQTAKEEAGVYEVVSENYLLLLGISSAIIIMIIIYFFSESFRVGRAIDKMLVYQGFQRLTSLDYSKLGEHRLGDFNIASAYNASHCGYQMYDYTSKKIVLGVLQSGARYLEFNIFNSEFGDKAYPVVSMGYKQGEWKMMVTDTALETIFETIANNAFKINDGIEGVPNPDDPLFIGLNLNTNSNLSCLNLIAFLITTYFSKRLLDNSYSFQHNNNIADVPIIKFTGNNNNGGNIIIFSSDGFQGSGLEELINYSWDNIDNNPKHSLQRLHYSTIMDPSYNAQSLIDYNKTGMTIIVPHQEDDFLNNNYNPLLAFDCGCQFIAMEFQHIDSNMDMYITRFKNTSFILKDSDLQKGHSNRKKPKTTIAPTTTKSIPRTTRGRF